MRNLMLMVGGVALSGSLWACKDKSPAPTESSIGTAPVSVRSDHLAENELLEGPDKAFGLTLPRTARVTYRFATAVHVEVPKGLEPVSNYLRTRVRDGNIQVGASETRFEKVRVPSDPDRVLRIRVSTQNEYTRMLVEDITPPPDLTGTPEERLRRVGLTKDGKMADPQHME